MKYLIRHNKLDEPNGKAHVISGEDTLCRMWSNPATNKRKNWKILGERGETPLCGVCALNLKESNSPTRKLSEVPYETKEIL